MSNEPYELSRLKRWRLLRSVGNAFGPEERWRASKLSDFALSYYLAYIRAGLDLDEARRLAPISASIGDDATNYKQYLTPPA